MRRQRGGFVATCLQRAAAMEAVPRAIVLASQTFTAGVPFLLVASALAPHRRDFAQNLIRRFQLHGAAAEQVRSLFLSSSDVRGAITWVSIVFVLVSAVNLAGSLQILYERCLSVEHIGLRARWRGVVWILGVGIYITLFVELRPIDYWGVINILRALVALIGSYAFWLWTPRILLGPRVPIHRLLPIAGLTSVAATILAVASPLYMPKMIRDDAGRFGPIGAAFALLSWLLVLAFLVVGSAVVASQIDRGGRRAKPTLRDRPGP